MIPDPNYIRWQFQPRLQCRAMKGQWIIFSSSLTAVYWMSLSYWYVVKTVLEKNKSLKGNQSLQSVLGKTDDTFWTGFFPEKSADWWWLLGSSDLSEMSKSIYCFVFLSIQNRLFSVYETLLRLSLKWLYWSMIVVQCFLVHWYSVWVFIAERIIMMLPNCGPKWASSFWQINNLHRCLYEPHILTC